MTSAGWGALPGCHCPPGPTRRMVPSCGADCRAPGPPTTQATCLYINALVPWHSLLRAGQRGAIRVMLARGKQRKARVHLYSHSPARSTWGPPLLPGRGFHRERSGSISL